MKKTVLFLIIQLLITTVISAQNNLDFLIWDPEPKALEKLKKMTLTPEQIKKAENIFSVLNDQRYDLAECLFWEKGYAVTDENLNGMFMGLRTRLTLPNQHVPCYQALRYNENESYKKSYAFLQKVLAKGFKVNTTTLLYDAIFANDVACFTLLGKNLTIKIEQSELETFAYDAVFFVGSIDMLKAVVEIGYKYSNTSDHSIIRYPLHCPEMFNYLLGLGADFKSVKTPYNIPLPFFAIEKQGACLEILEKLLQSGIYTKETRTHNGNDLFEHNKAVNKENAKEVKALLKKYIK